jgi:hypothetical protein
MAEQMDKAKLLDEMRTKYAALEDILAPLDETQMTTEGVNGDWSIKDVLAHITAWQHRLLVWLHAATQNEEPAISGLDSDEAMDRLNEQFYKENKSRPLDDVLTDFRTTYMQIVDEVQVLNEEDLTDPHRFTWMKGNPLWYIIAGNTYEHYQQHRGPIQEWLARSGKV